MAALDPHHASFAVPGKVVELCGASSSGKSQLLFITAAAGVVRNPNLRVAFVVCTSTQSCVSRFRSLIVSMVKLVIDKARHEHNLFVALPRARAVYADELARDGLDASDAAVEAAMRASILRATEEETAACLQQIYLVQLYDAGRLLLFLSSLAGGVAKPQCRETEDDHTSELRGHEGTSARDVTLVAPFSGADHLVDHRAVLLELTSAASHAKRAAEAVLQASASASCLWVFIDGLGAVLAAAIGGHSGHHAGHALMASVGRALHTLARTRGAAVLITNSVVLEHNATALPGRAAFSSSVHTVKPALGVTWAGVPDMTLMLSPWSNSGTSDKGDVATAAPIEGHGAPVGRVSVTLLKSKSGVSLFAVLKWRCACVFVEGAMKRLFLPWQSMRHFELSMPFPCRDFHSILH
jgi:hypothetical protein